MSTIALGLLLLLALLSASLSQMSLLTRRALVAGALAVLILAWLESNLWIGWLALGLTISFGRYLSHRYGRKREQRLMRRSFKWLGSIYAAGWLVTLLSNQTELAATRWLLAGGLAALASRSLLLVLLRSRIPRQRPLKNPTLPTVSICIPARNETHALTDALRGALASDYPKQEIIVLDDCSQDSTPDIIRAFAQDGVRFIQTDEPAENWIGKNQAYELLASEASGDVVLFIGVDIRLQPGSVRQMVNYMLANKSKLVSVLPRRRSFDWLSNSLRPLRYYWQLAFTAWPFAESCWLVDRNWLFKQKGFKPIKHHIRPGRSLAKVARNEELYAFFVSYGEAAITTRKRVASLYETAIRTQYPSLRREPILVLAKVWLLMAILALMASVWQSPADVIGRVINLATVVLWLSYIWSELVLQGRGGWVSGLMAPTAILGEVVSSLTSMLRYEFGRVDWKGRNVCLPVMHQRPRARRGAWSWFRSKKAPQS